MHTNEAGQDPTHNSKSLSSLRMFDTKKLEVDSDEQFVLVSISEYTVSEKLPNYN